MIPRTFCTVQLFFFFLKSSFRVINVYFYKYPFLRGCYNRSLVAFYLVYYTILLIVIFTRRGIGNTQRIKINYKTGAKYLYYIRERLGEKKVIAKRI